jgi:hypothetical protein
MAKFIVVHSVKVATDFVPETFGRLATLGPRFRLRDSDTDKYTTFQVYQCSCGKIKLMPIGNIGRTSFSCGCLRNERIQETCRTHGKSKTAEYRIWAKMIDRCTNPNNIGYEIYGGRGIRVCDRWLGENGFVNFISDIGERPSKDLSVDRHPNRDGNYEPGNVRWATDIEQANNKSNNRWLTVNGEQDTLANWSRRSGTGISTIKRRLKRGWSDTDAVMRPGYTNGRKEI